MGYEIIWEDGGVVKRFFDHVDDEDMLQSVIDTEQDDRFASYRYCINDFRDVTGLAIQQETVEKIAAIDLAVAKLNPHIKIAVVAKLPELKAAATAYANSPLNVYLTRVFDTMEEARRWLSYIVI